MTIKQYKQLTIGYSTELDTDLFVPMTNNDDYINQFAENAKGHLVVLDKIEETKDYAPNSSMYVTVSSGTTAHLYPDDKYLLTLQLRDFTLSVPASSRSGPQFWFIVNDMWVSMWYSMDDNVVDATGPLTITKSITAASIGITSEGEYPYNLVIETGTSGPTTTLYADFVSPINLTMERIV